MLPPEILMDANQDKLHVDLSKRRGVKAMKKLNINDAFNDAFNEAELESEREWFASTTTKETLQRGQDQSIKSSLRIVPVESEDYKEKIVVDDVSVSYTQEADCTSHEDEVQELKIFTQNNGVARFIVLETERWAISDIDELVEILKDFKQRAGIIK